MENFLLGCDWGTTSFRLRLINVTSGRVVGELMSQDGIAKTNIAWKQPEWGGLSRMAFFCKCLKQQIDTLASKQGFNPEGIPLVVSGMASSSIGMADVPYTSLPFSLNAEELNFLRVSATVDFPHEMILVSGLKTDTDVMRGEETQLIGLSGLIEIPAEQETVVILPGTHSKHNYIRNNVLVDFKTFMTGEVYELLTKHSILKDSVEPFHQSAWRKEDRDAFIQGVRDGSSSPLLQKMFTVRINHLFSQLDKSANSFYMSGLLIGSELSYLADENDRRPLVLCGGSQLSDLYNTAMDILGLANRVLKVPSDFVHKATIAGQATIFQNKFLTSKAT
ncbi:putative 2-dehydro-3-deoxygalactonokinase DgoK1 [Dyadobacter sp. CECT 9275]|uniref:2-dehydro-3-deoxygalactonokinase DgoK1 n=1 Tax=Dyadobacter helix TaxID=2822344 RepID=A0A916JEZ2_9BACT|nr:2-dehydro-3-deoxygalactonokinase [Dyadobacter sp. CECT 9275]CAG5008484.1 putative 2-dehydro-3-deoxygalactonokinase DgoK1 [Dyadobacter sp. CECT 9275]